VRLNAIAAQASQAQLAQTRPEGRCVWATPQAEATQRLLWVYGGGNVLPELGQDCLRRLTREAFQKELATREVVVHGSRYATTETVFVPGRRSLRACP
jgi:hypothetical protein